MFNLSELQEKITKAVGGAEKLNAIGDVLQEALPWGALAVLALTGNTQYTVFWLAAVLITAIVVYIMKRAFNKTAWGVRPDGGPYAFPSSHTSGAFSGAWVLVCVFGWVWGLIPLALACLTAFSRVYAKRHRWRDVIASAVVSGVIAFGLFTQM